jgi:hypothetical protein
MFPLTLHHLARRGALAAAICLTFAWANPARASDRAAWMPTARWGVMNHFLADWIGRASGSPVTVERWNELVDHFDVEALADQLKSVGASYYIISIGQNSGYYLSPNSEYDKIVGRQPSRCSRRDLVADLARALAKRQIRLMVYLPSGAPGGDADARKALGWENGPHRNREFQLAWEKVIGEWSRRWGSSVSGWWFDGCYWPNTMYRSADAPNFTSFAAAARAGNADSAIAFCPGVIYRTVSITPEEDYTAGEVDKPESWQPKRVFDGKADGAQVHVLSFLGQRWGTGTPRFTLEQITRFSETVVGSGGAITWDVPVQTNGTIAQPFLDQLAAVQKALSAPTIAPPPVSAD